MSGALFFAPPVAAEPVAPAKKPREKKPKAKNDPKLIAAARELRDRYLEHVNANVAALPAGAGKYDVSRAIDMTGAGPIEQNQPMLPAA